MIPAFGMLWQEAFKFKTRVVYLARLYSKVWGEITTRRRKRKQEPHLTIPVASKPKPKLENPLSL